MKRPVCIEGVPASIGVAVGPARLVARGRSGLVYRRISDAAVEGEVERFRGAVAASRGEIESAQEELTSQHGETYAPILDAYVLMHRDAKLVEAVEHQIHQQRINAQWAVSRVVDELKAPLLSDTSSYFRERARDLDHVKEHLLRHLSGGGLADTPPSEPSILIAHDLSPADAVHLLAPPTLGLVTEVGGANSHTAILARTFGVPTVVGVGPLPVTVEQEEIVVVDGFSGEVTIGAPAAVQEEAEARRRKFISFLSSERATKAVTSDGMAISVTANIELPTEIEGAIENGADGVGLYRTEFMCLDRAEPPPEEEQADIYRRVATAVAPNKVVFRTFDWRGDKRLRNDSLRDHERGWLKTQIRAVLRASTEGSVALMFPMVATVEQLRQGRALVDECRTEVGDTAVDLSVGMMVEVPSAALRAMDFAEHADFFAVGTNDLVQYTLGLDRRDYRVASASTPLDPAVLRLLDATIGAATAASIPCSMCGDMAADPLGLALALGLGYRQVSVPVSIVPLARAVIRHVDLGVATRAAQEALECSSTEDVRELAQDRFGESLTRLWHQHGIA